MPFAYAAAVVGAAISAYSSYQQADAQKKQANYEAEIAANNAKISAWQRSDALQRGDIEAQKAQTDQQQLYSRQKANLAANGLDISQGSALDTLSTTRFLGQQDVNTIQSNAAREAWGFEVQGGNSLAASNFEKWKASTINPTEQAAISGTSSLLSSSISYKSATSKKYS